MNRERRERRKVNEGIKIDEWREYFMTLLGGVKGKVVRGYRDRREEGNGEEGIGREEFKRAMGRLRNEKAAGIDGIPGEAWKYERGEDWKSGHGNFVIEYGKERDGQRREREDYCADIKERGEKGGEGL